MKTWPESSPEASSPSANAGRGADADVATVWLVLESSNFKQVVGRASQDCGQGGVKRHAARG
jgi:hypothetical protein